MPKIVSNMLFITILSTLSAQAMMPEQLEEKGVQIGQQQTQNIDDLLRTAVGQIQNIERELITGVEKDIENFLGKSSTDYYIATIKRNAEYDEFKCYIEIYKAISPETAEAEIIENIEVLNIHLMQEELFDESIKNIFRRSKSADMKIKNILEPLVIATGNNEREFSKIVDLLAQNSKFYYFLDKKLCTASSLILYILKCNFLTLFRFSSILEGVEFTLTRAISNRWKPIFTEYSLFKCLQADNNIGFGSPNEDLYYFIDIDDFLLYIDLECLFDPF